MDIQKFQELKKVDEEIQKIKFIIQRLEKIDYKNPKLGIAFGFDFPLSSFITDPYSRVHYFQNSDIISEHIELLIKAYKDRLIILEETFKNM